MLDYVLKSGAILAILFLFYKLVLENARIHHLKRGYLLFSLLAAFGIPLLVFTNIIYIPAITENFVINEAFSLEEPQAIVEKTNYLNIILLSIYGVGVFLFGTKFLINLFSIAKKIRQNPLHQRPPFTEVLLKELKSPYTFFKYIFLDKYKAETNAIPKEVLWHEEEHARQIHSADVLLIEAIQVMFWFNPILYFIKKSIKLNHEFLADEAVLNKGIPVKTYQQTILSFSSSDHYPQLSNALYYKPIKKRFTQMKTKTTKKAAWIKSLLILPLLAILIYSFSQKETEYLNEKEDISLHIKILKKDHFMLNQKYLSRFDNLNDVVTNLLIDVEEDQRKNIIATIEAPAYIEKGYITDITMQLSNIGIEKRKLTLSETVIGTGGKDETITREQRIEFNKKWKYLPEFRYTLQTYWVKNKNGKKIPQKYFELSNFYKIKWLMFPPNTSVERPISVEEFERIKDASTYVVRIDGIPIKNSKLNDYKRADFVTFSSNAISTLADLPQKFHYNLITERGFKLRNELVKIIQNRKSKSDQKEATPKQLATYNKLAKKYNAMLNSGDVYIKMTEVNQMKAIYAIMSAKQKKSAEPFPNIPPPPPPPPAPGAKGDVPPPPPPPIPANATPSQKAKYKKAIEEYKVLAKKHGIKFKIDENGEIVPPPPRNSAPPKQLAEYNKLAKKYNAKERLGHPHINDKEFKKMKAIYAVMSMEQKRSAEPFPPPPPPPPFPPNPTDHMIKLAKKGAAFYFEGKKISSDRAIELTKKNKSINVEVKEINGKKPQVKLTDKPIKIGYNDYPEIEEEIEEIVESPKVEEIEIVEEIEVNESPGVEELIEVTEVELEEIVEEEIEVVEEKVIEIPMQFPSTIKTNKTAIKGVISHNNKTIYFIKDKNGTNYYDQYGNSVKLSKNFKLNKGWVYINNETYYFTDNGKEIKYFNRFGKEADANGVLLK